MQSPSSGTNPVCTKKEAAQLLEDLKYQYLSLPRHCRVAVRNELLRVQHTKGVE